MKKAPNNLPAAGAWGEQLTLIDPPPFCPTWPKRNSLSDRALKMLLDGQVFDHPDFIGADRIDRPFTGSSSQPSKPASGRLGWGSSIPCARPSLCCGSCICLARIHGAKRR